MIQAHIQPRPANFRPILVLLAAGVLMTALANILLTSHATTRHGCDADDIRHALQVNEPESIWQSKSHPSVKAYCVELPKRCGTFGILISQVWPSWDCDERERTSFIPKDGQLENVHRYLSHTFRRLP